jgi:drug/metabolite transporter (DMT)-like permease
MSINLFKNLIKPLTLPLLGSLPTKTQSILYMIAGTFWFSVMTAIVRHMSHDLHVMEVAFFRNAFALLFMLPWLMRTGVHTIGTRKMWLYTWRGFNGMAAMVLWFTALSLIPLPQAVSLSFTTPLFTTLAAMIFLHEKVGIHRWSALIIGFIGTLVILRPGMDSFSMASLLVLGSSILWSISNILIKQLTRTESPHTIVFYMTLMMTPISLPLALLHWQAPTLIQYFWLIALAAVANLAQISISKAYGMADMSVVQPFDFTRLIFASIIAYFAFNEIIDLWTLVGAIIIVSSTVYISRREARKRKIMDIS